MTARDPRRARGGLGGWIGPHPEWRLALHLASAAAPVLIPAAARRTTRALKVVLMAGIVGLWLGATPT